VNTIDTDAPQGGVGPIKWLEGFVGMGRGVWGVNTIDAGPPQGGSGAIGDRQGARIYIYAGESSPANIPRYEIRN